MTETATRSSEVDFSRAEGPAWGWVWQAVTGVVLLVLLTVHMIAHHFVVADGLRSYAEVVDYLRSPVIFVVEHLFLVTVTVHAALGVRAVLLDLGPTAAVERRITAWLGVVGALTVAYGVWLLWAVAG